MKRKFILCPFRNGYFCLLITCIILNSAYGWTAQNSVINSKNFVQRISFELLHRVYKTPKFLGYILYECPSIKYVPSKFWSFIHPLLSVCLDTPLMTPFPTTCVRFLLSLHTKNTLWKLFCFVSYLRKSLSLTFLFSDSLVRADNPVGQSMKHNI